MLILIHAFVFAETSQPMSATLTFQIRFKGAHE